MIYQQLSTPGTDVKDRYIHEVGYMIMKDFAYAAIAAMAFTAQAQALTFKSGEVLGSDGQLHQGASPQQMERLVEKAKSSGDVGGVTGNNVFVVVGENVTFIPVGELKGLTKESQIAVVGDAVVQDLTGNPDITYEQVSAVNEISTETGLSVEEILNEGDIAGLDPEIMKEIEQVASETGISVENLVAVNAAIEAMPAGQAEDFMSGLEELIEEGMADQVDAFLTDLQEIEGAMDAITQFDSYESCVSGGGGDVCDQVQAAMDEYGT